MLQPGHRWIRNYRHRYAITADGQVFSYRRTGLPCPLRARTQTHGYQQVALFRHGQRRDPYVHDLVLATWGERRRRGHVALHRDGHPAHNTLTNLRWVTEAERTLHHQRAGRYGRKLTADDARVIYRAKVSSATLAIRYGVTRRTIDRIRSRDLWTTATHRLYLAERRKRLQTITAG